MAQRKFDHYMVHIAMGSHPKLAGLTDSEYRAHISGILAVAAMAPVRGRLLVGETEAGAAHVAKVAGVSTRAASAALRKLQDLGVLVRDDELGCLRVHDWEDINPEPKRDATAAKRQADYRARRAARNGDVTP